MKRIKMQHKGFPGCVIFVYLGSVEKCPFLEKSGMVDSSTDIQAVCTRNKLNISKTFTLTVRPHSPSKVDKKQG